MQSSKQNNKDIKVFVAMSGGVDSSLVAILLKEQGYDVRGITMRLIIDGINIFDAAEQDARQVADKLKIKHSILDVSKEMHKQVIGLFIDYYSNAFTPNPCVFCNQRIKFGLLFDWIRSQGGSYLATGHYVRNDSLNIRRGVDKIKDQSYFLCGIDKNILEYLKFPLGNMLKTDVKALAAQYNLSLSNKKESQDICFISKQGYKEFLKDRGIDKYCKPGAFIDNNGEVVGEHKGFWNYTIGQRDKLGIALGYPAYVYRMDSKDNIIYVGPKECLEASSLYAKEYNGIKLDYAEGASCKVKAQIRYHTKPVDAKVLFLKDREAKVVFDQPQNAITPGQFVAFYEDDVLLGGGVIRGLNKS